MSTELAIIQFPGSNCDRDMLEAFSRHFQIQPKFIWHSERRLPKVDGVIIPGGFSFGDYLRSGALAAHAPIMQEVREFARKGGAIMGICNGFQILTEAKLLPGALLRNSRRSFLCHTCDLETHAGDSPYHKAIGMKMLSMPIAHGEGRYYIDSEGLSRLESEGQILLRYNRKHDNPNGSTDWIAGITSKNGRILGLMPHPERATDFIVGGSTDGLLVLQGFLNATQS